jgi:hypothetical protein
MTTYENLVYPTLDSYDSIQNILLIDQSVTQYQVFYDSANASSYPILYNSLTKREDLSQLLSQFTHLDRIAFAFHGIYPGCYYDKPFLEEDPYFTLDSSGSVIVSENVSFVQSLISTFTVSHVDFLGCNLLLSEEWIKYFDVLSANSDCVVGASNDQTGNLKYGGDWILENTIENVRDTYFTSQIEDLTTTLLPQTITTNTTISQSDIASTTWPVTISGTNITVTFGSNLTLTSATHKFQITGSNVTINGGNNTVTVGSVTSYPGLFQFNAGLTNITLQNIKMVVNSPSTLLGGAFASDKITYPNGFNIINCSTSGTVTLPSSAGAFFGYGSNPSSMILSNTTITNSYNTLALPSQNGGFFPLWMNVGTSCTLKMSNCYNSGTIGSVSAGFIDSYSTLNTNAVINLTNCYNIANQTADYSGGFFGCNVGGSNGSSITLTNCYSIGNFLQAGCSAFFSQGTFFTGGTMSINMTKCYAIGSMPNLGDTGGFIGATVGSVGTITISNSYLFATPSSTIPMVNTSTAQTKTLTNCYTVSAGTWSDTSANAALTNTPTSIYVSGTVWTSRSVNTAYLLSSYTGNTYVESTTSFTGNLYITNTASTPLNTYTSSAAAYGTNLTLVSVNSANPATYATINATSGIISFSNLSTGTYTARVLSYTTTNSQYTNYVFSTFTVINAPLYPLNTYNHTFYTYSSATPTVLTRTVYNASGSLQSSTDISFGGQNIQTVLAALDSGSGPYTIGIKDTSNNKVSMDVAFFGAYNATLTQTQQNAMMTYVNANYKEPRTAATNYVVTVSGGVFHLNGVSQPNITFASGTLYVFDQSSPTNIGNRLVLGTTPDVSSSVVGNNVVYNGTPGSANAYTLIDFGGSNPATTSLYYFSSTTTGIGSKIPPFATNIYINSTTSTSVTSILLKPWTTVNASEPYKFSKTAGSGSYSGTYYVSSSTICDNNTSTFSPVQMFDISYSAAPYEYGWLCKRGQYNDSGVYLGSISTTYNTSSTITGEWAQIQIPYALNLKNFTFLPTSNWVTSLPATFYILGSNNGTTWTNLYSVSNYVYSTTITSNSQFTNASYLTTFTLTPVNNAYSYFRLVVNRILNANSGFTGLKQWNLYGDAYAAAF